jgi:hypothetical protein
LHCDKEVFMKRIVGVVLGAAMMAGLVGVMPAAARPGDVVTVTCTGGQTVVSDVHSLFGQTTANGVYNAVNPFGEVCTVAGP